MTFTKVINCTENAYCFSDIHLKYYWDLATIASYLVYSVETLYYYYNNDASDKENEQLYNYMAIIIMIMFSCSSDITSSKDIFQFSVRILQYT